MYQLVSLIRDPTHEPIINQPSQHFGECLTGGQIQTPADFFQGELILGLVRSNQKFENVSGQLLLIRRVIFYQAEEIIANNPFGTT